VRKLWNPCECPADVLPWLAFSLSVEPWRSDWSEARKRAAIAASIETHRVKGTIGAVRRALSTLGYEVDIDETTGQAYTFRLEVDVEGRDYTAADVPAMEAALDEAEDATLAAKNARSHLAGVFFMVKRGLPAIPRAVLADGESTGVEAHFKRNITRATAIRTLSALTGLETTTIYPWTQTDFTFSAVAFGALVQHQTIKFS
jgi:phage tail P2-like protein